MAMQAVQPALATPRPRLAFLGLGWIGRNRMEAVVRDGTADVVALSDASAETVAAALEVAPHAEVTATLAELVDAGPDGIVIATPSALHAEQAIHALEAGIAVFCQKPLGRNAAEAAAVIDAARRADRLLGVDFSYRCTRAMREIRTRLNAGEIGPVHAVELVFHNAYGPDKPWFYDRTLSGGGCVMDLGVHLVDLLLWSLGSPDAQVVCADLRSEGERLRDGSDRVEDHALATLRLDTGAVARIACSWRGHAGEEADIRAVFHGRSGALAFGNLNGSFYDFAAELRRGTQRQTIVSPPDDWGGRAAVEWVRRLAVDNRFDSQAEGFHAVSKLIDGIYGRGGDGR